MFCIEKCYGCCGGRFQPSHVALVNNVYPTTAGEEGPKSSNLSLLVFQAQSKPNELPKICSYLESKVKRDVYRNRMVYVRVSLQILNALIKDCNLHLTLFAKHVVNIVTDLLQAPDLDLLTQVTATVNCFRFTVNHSQFCLFSQYHDHAILDVDPEFMSAYINILQRYQAFCQYQHTDPKTEFRHRQAGLRAVNAVVSQPSFAASHDLEHFLSIMLPGVIVNILAPDDPEFSTGTVGRAAGSAGLRAVPSSHQLLVSDTESLDRRKSASDGASMPDMITADSELDHLAEASLAEIMRNVTAGNFWTVFIPLFKSFDESGLMDGKPEECIRIAQITTTNLHPQHRNLLVSSILHRMSGATTTLNVSNLPKGNVAPTAELPTSTWVTPPLSTNAKATSVRVLTSIISVGGSTIGLTVLELLDSLTRHLYWVIYTLIAKDKGQLKAVDRKEVEYLEAALIESIGGLATNLYYPNQINDIIGFIINRLRLDIPHKAQTAAPLEVKRQDSSAQELVASGEPLSPNKLYSLDWNSETYDAITLTEVRKALLRCLHRVLRSNLAANALYTTPMGRDHVSSQSVDMKTQDMFAGVKRAPVPEQLVSPMLIFLQDADAEIRMEFFYFLYYFLIGETGQEETTPNTSSLSIFSEVPGMVYASKSSNKRRKRFRQEMHSALFHYATSPHSGPADYAALFELLVSMLKRYGEEELVDVIPMLFAVQEEFKKMAKPSQQRAFGNVFLEYLAVVGDMYGTTRLPFYVSKVPSFLQKD
jgi:hypothetical protein